MYVIVGLGNPGKEYEYTRHNVGFDAVEELIEKNSIPQSGVKFHAMYGKGMINGEKVVIAKPLTYMNLSGQSVRELVDYFKIDPKEELIILYDDIDLEPGQIRIRSKGSAGGHNGIKSIIQHLAIQEFTRIKIGVGSKQSGWDLADHVLGRFSKEERSQVDQAISRSLKAVEMILEEGITLAMNEFNRKI